MVKILKAYIITLIFLFIPFSITFAVEKTVVYLSILNGQQNTGSPAPLVGQADEYLATLETQHGTLKENRMVRPQVYSFDFYSTSGKIASGIGLDVFRYHKSYNFANDNTKIDIEAAGVLYGFNFYYRGDYWFPFIGFGTGNYLAKISEHIVSDSTTTSGTFFGQVKHPVYYKFGIRIPLNSWGIVMTQQYTAADLNVTTEGKTLSLGGTSTLFGLYYGF